MAELSHSAAQVRWVHHESVDSTNDFVLAAARRGEAAGLWVTADRQLKGRGRGGRVWASEPGNFHGSHLYVTARPVGALGLLPLAAGLGVGDAIADIVAGGQAVGTAVELAPDSLPLETGQSPMRSGFLSPPGRGDLALKWPNDVLIGGAKVAGILLESETLPSGSTAVAIGCGINLAHHPADAAHATHLAAHGAAYTIPDLLPVLARRMSEALDLFGREPDEVSRRWLAAAHGVGGPILVRLPSASYSGTFAGLDRSGRLILEDENGSRRLISAGDVFFGEAIPAGEDAA